MNLAYTLVTPDQGPVLVRPLKNRAFQVANVRESRRPQTLRHFSGTITNSAISHDRCLFRQTCANALLIVSCAGSLLVVLTPQLLAQEKTKIRISYPNVSIASLALFAAQQWKIFEQNGLP